MIAQPVSGDQGLVPAPGHAVTVTACLPSAAAEQRGLGHQASDVGIEAPPLCPHKGRLLAGGLDELRHVSASHGGLRPNHERRRGYPRQCYREG